MTVSDLILRAISPPYDTSDLGRSAFRTALETAHATLMRAHQIVRPSLELGIGDGISSMFINGERGQIFDVGLDMPAAMTWEFKMFDWHPHTSHYREFVGASMEAIPFADGTFATVYTSETMFYGMDMQKTANEISRVLAPGGTFYGFIPTDAWNYFTALFKGLQKEIVSAKFASDEEMTKFFTDAGLDVILDFRFFSPAIETLLQKLKFRLPSALPAGNSLLEGSQKLLEYECYGDPNGFHALANFRKPGELPAELQYRRLSQLRCVQCRGAELSFSNDAIKCSCGSTFAVKHGTPQMIRADQKNFSPKDRKVKIHPEVAGRLAALQAAYEQECVTTQTSTADKQGP